MPSSLVPWHRIPLNVISVDWNLLLISVSCENEARQSPKVPSVHPGSQEREKSWLGQVATLQPTFRQRPSLRSVSLKKRLVLQEQAADLSHDGSCRGGGCRSYAWGSDSRLRRSF